MAFTYYESEEQVDQILSKIDEESGESESLILNNVRNDVNFTPPGCGGGVL